MRRRLEIKPPKFLPGEVNELESAPIWTTWLDHVELALAVKLPSNFPSKKYLTVVPDFEKAIWDHLFNGTTDVDFCWLPLNHIICFPPALSKLKLHNQPLYGALRLNAPTISPYVVGYTQASAVKSAVPTFRSSDAGICKKSPLPSKATAPSVILVRFVLPVIPDGESGRTSGAVEPTTKLSVYFATPL